MDLKWYTRTIPTKYFFPLTFFSYSQAVPFVRTAAFWASISFYLCVIMSHLLVVAPWQDRWYSFISPFVLFLFFFFYSPPPPLLNILEVFSGTMGRVREALNMLLHVVNNLYFCKSLPNCWSRRQWQMVK